MVSNLCEAAAEAVNANPILTRVGAFYHDIGKLKRPLFFVENQSYFGIENPHSKLNPRLSKMVITAHRKTVLNWQKNMDFRLLSITLSFSITAKVLQAIFILRQLPKRVRKTLRKTNSDTQGPNQI